MIKHGVIIRALLYIAELRSDSPEGTTAEDVIAVVP